MRVPPLLSTACIPKAIFWDDRDIRKTVPFSYILHIYTVLYAAMSGRVCSICISSNRSEVEDALLHGDSVRAVAGRHGLSKSAVSRHRQNCLAPKVAAAARLLASAEETRSDVVQAEEILNGEILPSYGDVLALTGLLSRLARSLDRLDGAADQAARNDTYMALSSLSGQLHRGIEAAARMQGLNNSHTDEKERFSISINLGA
jgi:hypothetical protein